MQKEHSAPTDIGSSSNIAKMMACVVQMRSCVDRLAWGIHLLTNTIPHKFIKGGLKLPKIRSIYCIF